MTHGITNRMTGGGTGLCLQTTEAGGTGESWSDAFAEFVSSFFLLYHIHIDVLVLIAGLSKSRRPPLTTLWVHMWKPAGIQVDPYSTNP